MAYSLFIMALLVEVWSYKEYSIDTLLYVPGGRTIIEALSSFLAAIGILKPLVPPPFNVSVMLRLVMVGVGRELRSMPLSSKLNCPERASSAVIFICVSFTLVEKLTVE